MNEILVRQIAILSAFFGAVLAVATLVPVLGKLSFMVLLCLMSPIVVIIMTRLGYMGKLEVRESVAAGGIIGFVSFVVFCMVFLPLFALLSKLSFYNMYEGVLMVLKAGTFGIIMMFVVFMGVVSATVNAFSAFLTFYVADFINK